MEALRAGRSDAVVFARVEEAREMKRRAAVILLALATVSPVRANEPDVLARFSGGIGVNPISGFANPQNPDGTFPNVFQNVVRGVSPSTQLWRISDLDGEIRTDGRVMVKGRGLLLASGARIGQSLGLAVFATLLCEVTAPVAQHSTTVSTALAPNGNFYIEGRLNSVPSDCPSPLLLIRNSAGQWVAAGILKLDGDAT
jgi:hypothetical protein